MGKDPGGGEKSFPHLSFDVQLVELLPDGPVIWLRDLIRRPASAHQHSFYVGSGADNDIVIHGNPEVADTHCILQWTARGLEARDFAPGKLTEFNDVELVDGHVLLRPHNVLTIGGVRLGKRQVTRILVHGRRPQRRPQIPARDYQEFVLKTRDYLGKNDSRAAETIKLERTTYKRHLDKFAAALAVTGVLAVGGFWMSSTSSIAADDGSESASKPALTAPAASLPPPQEPNEPAKKSVPMVEEEKSDNPPAKSLPVSETSDEERADKPVAKRSKRRQQKRARKREMPRARGVSYHSPVGARGVSARDVRREDESNR